MQAGWAREERAGSLLELWTTVPRSLMLTIPIFFCIFPLLPASSTFNESKRNHLEAVPGKERCCKWAVLLFEGLVFSAQGNQEGT